MNFDPISYAIQRVDLLQMRVKDLEERDQRKQEAIGNHDKRIDSLELWRASLMRLLQKWPYLAAPAVITTLNLAPEETVKLAIDVLKAAV